MMQRWKREAGPTVAPTTVEREHYLFINMRDRGCNCGVRYHDIPLGAHAALEAAQAAHVASIAEREAGQ